jgi:hypothetical protein
VRLQQRAHHVQVRPVRPARHRQQAHAQAGQPRVFHRPAGLVDQHGIARLQQRARHDVQPVRGAQRGDDLARRAGHADVGQPVRQRLAQARVAGRVAVLQAGGAGAGRFGRHRAAQRGVQQRQVQPFGRQRAHAGRRQRVVLEHAADQRGRVHRRRAVRARRRGRATQRFGRPRLAHEEAALAARLHQPLRQQLVVGGHHRGRAHAVAARAVAHRGQAGAGHQQPLADALGVARGQLLGQRGAGGAGQQRGRQVVGGVHGLCWWPRQYRRQGRSAKCTGAVLVGLIRLAR